MKNNSSLVYNFSLIIGDFLALIVAFVVAYVLRISLGFDFGGAGPAVAIYARNYLLTFLALLPFFIVIFGLLGLYNNRVHEQRFSELGRLFVGTLLGVMFLISYGYMTDTPIFPAHLVAVYGFALAFFFVLLFRTIARGLRRQMFSYGLGINDVIVVGDTRLTHTLIESMANTKVTGYRVIAVVGHKKHPHKENTPYELFDTFSEAVAKFGQNVHTIIQTELYSSTERNDEVLTYAQENHTAYRFVPGNSELYTGNLDVEIFHGVPVIAVHQTALVGWGRIVKRLTDIVLGSLALLIASPLFILIFVLEKLMNRGPAVFSQTRLTRFATPFKLYKFRTQYAKYDGTTPEEAFKMMGKPELGKIYRANGDSLPNDPRVTKLGKWLRITSLDELPQLINVVKGDISLVGPRALIPEEIRQHNKKNLILTVKSGLTGLAVVSGRRDISFEERRRLDLYYVQNWSFWNDMVIMVKTVWVLVVHKGAR